MSKSASKATQIIEQYVRHGLSVEEVASQSQDGKKNTIASKPIPSDIHFFLAQFKSPLAIVLLLASIITAFLGHYTDTVVILGAVVLNALIGFYQERKAFKSMQALSSVVTQQAWVLRNGSKKRIAAEDIVVGDVVLLYEGDKVPADGVFVSTSDVVINEAVLTGESVPVTKESHTLQSSSGDLADILRECTNIPDTKRSVKGSLGTVVVSGIATMIVTHIGMDTEMGHIALSIDEQTEKVTPLEIRMNDLAKKITIAIIVLASIIFTFGLSTDRSFSEMFIMSVALAVSAIPEGLVVALTAVLAVGMHRILQKKALVRNLVATETLGTVTRVCVDKTGTLTKGKLAVTETKFTDDSLAYRTAVLANELRDPLEFARWKWAEKYANKHKTHSPTTLQENTKIDDRIPFSSERRFLAVRVKDEVFVVGAPETIAARSTVSKSTEGSITRQVQKWAQSGKRIIGMGYRKCDSVAAAKRLFAQLSKNKKYTMKVRWIGLMGFTDPVRSSVKPALERAKLAGISVTVITGDYKETAQAVMAEVGLEVSNSQSLNGHELEGMSDRELAEVVQKIQLFARTKPSQKLRIVKALQSKKEVVAMMGDGVNDAPALAAAEIGLVVGDASDIARESADIVLLDSNFSTILSAVEEGRSIFANLRKIILFLLSDTFSEVILVMGSIFLGLPLAITAAQVLWINIVDDVFPNLALTVDPKEPGLLEKKPLSVNEKILNGELQVLIGVISIVTGLSTLYIYTWSLPIYGVDLARTLSFALLAFDSLVYVFSCRTITMNIWEESPFVNKWLLGAVLMSSLAAVIPIYVEPLQSFFSFEPLQGIHWLIVAVVAILVTVTVEVIKYVYKHFLAFRKQKNVVPLGV